MTPDDDTVYDQFEAVLLDFADTQAIGWRCKTCGWEIATDDLPPAHECPDDGVWQRVWLESVRG